MQGFEVIIVIILVLLSGIFAGLTLALFTLDLTTLERKIKLGDHKAEKVHEVRKKGNLLLTTLLLGNVASYTIMAIFLASVTSGVFAGIVSTALIFVFGEILPQAIFPRYALAIGYRTTWLVKVLMVIFYPIAGPIAWALDRLLGEELPVVWSKKEIKEIIKYHEDSPYGTIDEDEKRIALGALSFSDKRVSEVMIPKEQVFSLHVDQIIDQKLLQTIDEKDFSRIPIFKNKRDRIVGILFAKNLIALGNKKPPVTVNSIGTKKDLIWISPSTTLDHLLNLFIQTKSQIALVENTLHQFLGMITLEDILEVILKKEIEEHV